MEELKIGYYVKYSDPKDGENRNGLVINFDDDIVIIWSQELKCPYPVPRMNIKEIKKFMDYFKVTVEEED